MARPEGLEPSSYWFEASNFFQLSYRRIGGEEQIRTVGGTVSLAPLAKESFKPLSHFSRIFYWGELTDLNR